MQQAIRHRAEEIYVQSGRIAGRDVENWTQAEREILELTARQNRRCAIIVKVHGVQYVGEYTPESADGYVPGEIGEGASVGVRIEGDKMFVRRSNGKELQTDIVRKIGLVEQLCDADAVDILQGCSACLLLFLNGLLIRRC